MEDKKLAQLIQDALVEYYQTNWGQFYALGTQVFNPFNTEEHLLTEETECYYLLGVFFAAYHECFYSPYPMHYCNDPEEQLSIQSICYENAVYCFLKIITNDKLETHHRYSAAMRLLLLLHYNDVQAYNLMLQFYATKKLGYNAPAVYGSNELSNLIPESDMRTELPETIKQLRVACYVFFTDSNNHVLLSTSEMNKLRNIIRENNYSDIVIPQDQTNLFYAKILVLTTIITPLLRFMDKYVLGKNTHGPLDNIWRIMAKLPSNMNDFEENGFSLT